MFVWELEPPDPSVDGDDLGLVECGAAFLLLIPGDHAPTAQYPWSWLLSDTSYIIVNSSQKIGNLVIVSIHCRLHSVERSVLPKTSNFPPPLLTIVISF